MDAAKRIFLHIGHYKTGSSAIQGFLSRQAAALRRHGFLYPASARPRNNHTNHGHLSLSLAREYGFIPPPWYGEDITVDQAYGDLAQEMAQAPERNVILSSEEFVQLALRQDADAAVADLKRRLPPGQVTILFYIREPLSLLRSWFNEVNKGPRPTRGFPVFFRNMRAEFLSQRLIHDAYARHFGADNMRLLTYGAVGNDHITGFLDAVGCPLRPQGQVAIVQEGQPLAQLEQRRLSRIPPEQHDQFTLTALGDIAQFRRRAQQISADYDMLAALSDRPQPSRLSAASVIDHHAELLRTQQGTGRLNQKEADNLRNLALRAEPLDLDLARALMEAAFAIRPNGPFIQQKAAEYRDRLSRQPS